MNRPQVHGFFDAETFTVSYVVADPATGRAAIIDSVLDFDAASGRTQTASADLLIGFVQDSGLTVDWILETHVHADHLSAAPHLKAELGATTGIGKHVCQVQETFRGIFNLPDLAVDGSQFDRLINDGDHFQVGDLEVHAMHTPGHTPACMTYVIGDAAFVGDTLFMPDYGTARADFPGGDAGTLYDSIQKLFALPADTRLYLCHDYKAPGRDEFAWETTVAEQRASNVHVHEGVSREAFIAMRETRDRQLSMPKLILPSIQVNVRAGLLPAPEDNGVSYLKLPLNTL